MGVFADKPLATTGMSIVCTALARELAKYNLKVIYFGRYGLPQNNKMEFAQFPDPNFRANFLYVPCIGGVWQALLVSKLIRYYKLDVIFSEDDWFSAMGLALAAEHHKKPLHLLTPIDSLPLHLYSKKVFDKCHTIYVPNSAYKVLREKGYRSVFLPHGVDSEIFQPKEQKFDKFTFIWVGRDDFRKALGKALQAFEATFGKYHGADIGMVIHADWNTPMARKTKTYIKRKNLPVLLSQMKDTSHNSMVSVYNLGHVNLCTARAGGFEMSITEAGACGLPSLVTNWTFMRENILDGKTGFLIPWSSLQKVEAIIPRIYLGEEQHGRIWANIDGYQLAEKMMWCWENQDEIKKMGQQARDYITKTFKWEKVGSILEKNITQSVSHA